MVPALLNASNASRGSDSFFGHGILTTVVFHKRILAHLMLVISPIHDAIIVGSRGGIRHDGWWQWGSGVGHNGAKGGGACNF